jgi:hypothetical protein
VAPAIVCRDVYYPGAKYLVPILQLLIPGIDLVRMLFSAVVVVVNIDCVSEERPGKNCMSSSLAVQTMGLMTYVFQSSAPPPSS